MYDPGLCQKLLVQYCPEFYQTFLTKDEQSPLDLSKTALDAFATLQRNVFSSLNGSLHTRDVLIMVKAALFLRYDKATFEAKIKALFTTAFKAYHNLTKADKGIDVSTISDDGNEDADVMLTCSVCSRDKLDCCCRQLLDNFKCLCTILSDLQMTNTVASPAIASVLHGQITMYINESCKGEFMKSFLEECVNWTECHVLGWLAMVFNDSQDGKDGLSDQLSAEDWRERLHYFLYKNFAEMRISELFEIIVEYPESQPAVADLKECLMKTELRSKLIQSLRQSFEKRLLHPAVNTSDIITQLISAIKMLRYLDPTGVILERVCLPLREYLRQREDTIRCVIISLTDQDSGAELVEELFSSDGNTMDNTRNEGAESDGEDWMPDPIDALPDPSTKGQRTADIINVLINIYGSKDLFVSEYRTLLADRILSSYSYDITHERRYLELLKRRFGENHLHYCDVMLKDVQDSQRINRQIKTQLQMTENTENSVDLDALILSGAFWPSLKEDVVDPPENVKSIMELYAKEFETAKGMRSLEWLSNLGKAELEIELGGCTKCLTCTPAQAVVITKFAEKDSWSLAGLSAETKMSSAILQSRLSFWVSQGIINETTGGQFTVAKSFQTGIKEAMYEGNEEDSFTAETQDMKEEELQVYWSYVVGMLTNIGSLSLDRIHSMLKMFAMNGPGSRQCSKDDVKDFLQNKIDNGELQLSNNAYTLPK